MPTRFTLINLALLTALTGSPATGFSQQFHLLIRPVLHHEIIKPEHPLSLAPGDSLRISTLKFYLGNFEFRRNGQVVWVDKTCHLLDLEDENSLDLSFSLPENTTFDSIFFDLGTDSLSNISGAMGGDLDPTKGMFWSWQSGYINLKLEGYSMHSPAESGIFQFHLGGYVAPFQTSEQVKIKAGNNQVNTAIDFELAAFFQSVNWQKKSSIMSPGPEAVRFMDVLAQSFTLHEK